MTHPQRILFSFSLIILTTYCAKGAEIINSDSTRTHSRLNETLADVKQLHTLTVPKIQEPCSKTVTPFDPPLVDYRKNRVTLTEPGGRRPSIVIVASPDAKDKVLKFLSEFAKPIWTYRQTARIYESVKRNGSKFLYDSWNESVSEAWQGFKKDMAKLDDIRVLILADARPLYKSRLDAGLKAAAIEREAGIEKGRTEGAAKGAMIGARKGRDEYSLPVFRTFLGLAEEIGRVKGREEGARRGAEIAKEVADTLIPPYVTFLAESELMKKADELLPAVKKVLQEKLLRDFETQSWLSILVDPKDFANGLTEEGKEKLDWANTYVEDSKKLDSKLAIATHSEFMNQSNSADEVLKGLIGNTDSGFHVILIDPNGNTIKSWSNENIHPVWIAGQYIKYLELFQRGTDISGCH